MKPMKPMKFTVPFIPDPSFEAFLAGQKPHLAAIYFSLLSGPVMDARVRFTQMDAASLGRKLARFADIPCYGLFNTRFIPPRQYLDAPFLNRLLDSLQNIASVCRVDGIVFTDFYLLNALDRTGHDLIPSLEAVPGVNCLLDSPASIFSLMAAIGDTRFRLPGKLILDRSLNRDFDGLRQSAGVVRKRFPNIRIELLANEGCLLHCPFKLTHDAQISLANAGLVRENTHAVNQAVGCHAHFYRHPHAFLKSPFIRPEDQHQYEGLADSLKICGRTLGPGFLTRTLSAYISQSFDGNLLALMDATRFLADRFFIDNQRLGTNFLNTLANCDRFCKTCRKCNDLFKLAARKRAAGLKSFKEFQ